MAQVDKIQNMYKSCVTEALPLINKECLPYLTLPLHPNMTDSDVAYIIEVIKNFPHA